ncbi:MAG: N-acetyltransferase family protein [Clostridiales bacterium]|nr:N-acetyltransferase family protein [Clostridiales bacterium]
MAESIRTATPDDAAALLDIYGPYILETAVTFEYDVPTEAEFARRIAHTVERYPWLVLEADGQLEGYAYAGTFIGRRACDWAVEASIYIRRDCRKHGYGRRLYQALEAVLRRQNVVNVNACIACPEVEDEYLNRNSVNFHQHMGYRMVGGFHKCGYKFGRWYQLVWMEKMLGSHLDQPPEFVPFPALEREEVDEILAQF